MIVTLHSESLPGLNRDKLHARVAELEAQFPGSVIKARRWPRYGGGYNLIVKGEGEATRVQRRGHCQFCGNHQVVKDGVLVLHGYQRPGNGWIFGRCPGAAELPLQSSEVITRATLQATQERLADLQKAEPRHERALTRAQSLYDQNEPGMIYAMPSKPYQYGISDAEKAAQTARYERELAAWLKAHPFTARYVKARDNKRALDVSISQAKGGVEHFTLLLSWKLLGTALVEVAK